MLIACENISNPSPHTANPIIFSHLAINVLVKIFEFLAVTMKHNAIADMQTAIPMKNINVSAKFVNEGFIDSTNDIVPGPLSNGMANGAIAMSLDEVLTSC